MYFLAGQEGSIYRNKDESTLVKFGTFKITGYDSKPEVSEARVLGNRSVSRFQGHSKTSITVEGSANTTIGIGDKVFFRSRPTVGTKSFYQWWGTFTEFSLAAYEANTFTGQIAVEDMKLTTA